NLDLIVIKKASILTLLFLFFVSTTGLPFSVEFCNLLHREIQTECSLLTPSKGKDELHCPFEMEKAANKSVSFKDENCCSEGFIIVGVKDSFISNKTESQNQSVTIVLPISNYSLPETEQEISTYTFIDTSPPLLQNNSLYLSNSVLLI
ncbi:MAG: hypothetical protein WB779_12020, partial [Ignavibacteriaceae bacterium]